MIYGKFRFFRLRQLALRDEVSLLFVVFCSLYLQSFRGSFIHKNYFGSFHLLISSSEKLPLESNFCPDSKSL